MKELTLFNLGDMKYGIWRDKFQGIKEVKSIHWLPPDPGFISGMSVIEGRTITLFDLSACLGLPSINRKKGIYSVLLCEYDDKHAAFMVDFVIGNYSIPLEAVFSMPEYLRTEVVDTCAVHASEPIPVITISHLFKNVLETDFKPVAPNFHISGTQIKDVSSVKAVRVFKSGDDFFALPATCVEKKSLTTGTVSRMAMLPAYVNGITVQKEKILPQIHLSRRMKLPEHGTGEIMLVADINGQDFGLLVDSDIGQWRSKNFIVKPLPALVQSDWQKNAIILAEKIIPVIDPGQLLTDQLLTSQADGFDATPLPQRYNPGSNFKDLFSSKEVEVIEFSLFGVRHAIPKSEVEDHIGLKPYRKLPDIISIVAGVAEHDGELLPVLDLAVCFGRQSVVKPQWRMILVKNGDFKALILTEAVLDERLLPVKIQYSLPFGDTMSLVYGCYTDEAEARLILNVQALAVNFDETRFKKFFGAFAIDQKKEPANTEPIISKPDVFEETLEEIKPDSADELEILTEAYDLSHEEETDDEINLSLDNLEEEPETEIREDATEEESTQLEEDVLEQKDTPEDEVPEDKEINDLYVIDAEDTLDEELEIDAEIADQDTDDDELFDKLSDAFDSSIDPLPEPIEEAEEEDQELFDKLNKAFDSTMDQTTESESEELQDVIEEILFNEKDEDGNEPSVVQLEQEMEVLPDEPEVEVEAKILSSAKPPVEKEMGEAEIVGLSELSAPEESETAWISKAFMTIEESIKEQKIEAEKESEQYFSDYYNLKTPAQKKLKKRIVYATLAVLLLFGLILIYFSGGDISLSNRYEKVKVAPPAVAEQHTPDQAQPDIPLSPQKKPETPPTAKPVETKEEKPAEKVIPAKHESTNLKPVSPPEVKQRPPAAPDLTTYTVKKGDTLWSISKQHTGNGFNYPGVAENNEIKTPDLIFPDQKITISK